MWSLYKLLIDWIYRKGTVSWYILLSVYDMTYIVIWDFCNKKKKRSTTKKEADEIFVDDWISSQFLCKFLDCSCAAYWSIEG